MNGFHYLRSAILLSISDLTPDRSKITKVYNAVAEEYAVTPKQVERSIRNAINQAWAWRDNCKENGAFSLCDFIPGLVLQLSDTICLRIFALMRLRISIVSS